MKPLRGRNRDFSKDPVEPKTPKLPEKTKKPLTGLNINHMQALAHNAVLWCDHDGGTILDKNSHPFAAHLEMENILDPVAQKTRAARIQDMLKSMGSRKDDKRSIEDIARDAGMPLDLKTKNRIEARFRYMTSPYSNGNLSVNVWCDGVLVFSAYDNPGPAYQYPSEKMSVTVYEKGPWEQFLLSKNYHNTEGKRR